MRCCLSDAFGEADREFFGDGVSGLLTAGLEPVADPVQRTGDGEGRELRVAGSYRTVRDARGDIVAEGAIDPPLRGLHDLAVVLAEIAEIEADQALAVVRCHQLGVADGELAQLVEAAAAAGRGLGNAVVDQLVADRPALEQDLVLAAEVIIERGLGDVQPLGDVVQRGAVIALFEEQGDGRAQHRLALFVAGAAPALERQPGRLGVGKRVAGVHRVAVVALTPEDRPYITHG